jgi:hypothetical protein
MILYRLPPIVYVLNLLIFLLSVTHIFILPKTAGIFFFSLAISTAISCTQLSLKKDKAILILLLSSLLIFAFTAPSINTIDLWGDESNIVQLAKQDIRTLTHAALREHTMAPPMSYWIMWGWNKILSITPSVYIEIISRIPFMGMHLAASLLFFATCRIVLTASAIKFAKNASIIAFFTFFLCPLLLTYSAIEIKFYALAVLGSVFILYAFATNKLTSVGILPLHMIFYLSSFFHYILVFPYLFYNIFSQKNKTSILMLIACSLIIFALMLIVGYSPPSGIPFAKNALVVFIKGLKEFLIFTFIHPFQLVLVMVLFLRMLFTSFAWTTVISLLFSFATIFLLQMTYHYSDFGARHFIFILPTIIFLLFQGAFIVSKKLQPYYLIAVFLLFTLPWGMRSFAFIKTPLLIPKDTLGLKQVFRRAEKEKRPILLHIPQSFITRPEHDFYLTNISYYKTLYPSVKIQTVISHSILCTSQFIVFQYHAKYPCEGK